MPYINILKRSTKATKLIIGIQVLRKRGARILRFD